MKRMLRWYFYVIAGMIGGAILGAAYAAQEGVTRKATESQLSHVTNERA